MFAVQILVSSVAVPTPKGFGQFRHLFIFYPVMIIFASSLIVAVFEKLWQSSKLRFAFLCFLFLLIFIPTITNFYHAFRSNLKTSSHNFKEIGEMVKNNTSEDEVVVTNRVNEIGWYSKRKVTSLYYNRDQLSDLNSKYPVKSMVITSSVFSDLKFYNFPNVDKKWKDLLKQSEQNKNQRNLLNNLPDVLSGYKLKQKLVQNDNVVALLYKKQ